MTSTIKIIIGVLVLGAIGGGAYYYSTSPVKEMQSETATIPEATGKKMAFADFVKNDTGSYKCTVHQSVANTDSTGTVYVANKMISGQFTTMYNGQKIDTSFIMRDGYSYGWTSMMPTMGYKVKVDTDTQVANTNAAASGSYSFNAQQIGDYNCEIWTTDESKFAVPSSVTFKALN